MVSARYGGSKQRLFGQDSAVIVDADKSLPSPQFQLKSRNPQFFRRLHYPYYQIMPRTQQLPQSKEAPMTTTSTTTVAPAIIYTKDEFPADLLDIAQNKLGIKRLEEIPSISELGDLLGTQSVEETIKYMRELTATEDGIALVKAYIESSDYTDSSAVTEPSLGVSTTVRVPADLSSNEDITQPGFFERMSNYLNFFEFFASASAPRSKEDEEANSLQQLDRITSHGKQQQPIAAGNVIRFQAQTPREPMLVRNPLPYHYPIPIRPVVLYHPKGVAAHSQRSSSKNVPAVVHLNTPKMIVPVFQINKKATRPTRKTTTPKQHQQLDDLAAKVSKFPLTHNRDALIDAQYLAAIEKAFAEDEDLKKILGSTETLK